MTAAPATLIVFGNEKGGSGKSTAALHVTVGLMRAGWRVASIDLDARQGTLSRYLDNRRAFAATLLAPDLPMPEHRRIAPGTEDSTAVRQADEAARLEEALEALASQDFVVIDTPGSDTHLGRLAHARADVLVTPINDSFIDLDLLATVEPDRLQIKGASIYAETVWNQRKARFARDRGGIDWIVMRNRLGHTEAKNKQQIGRVLEKLSKRIGFRIAPGFGERVIFRELFLKGLTLLDLREVGEPGSLSLSHLAARQEVRALIETIDPDRQRAEASERAERWTAARA